MTSCFDSPERSCLIVFGHCSISKCVFCSQSGHSHVSSSSQPQRHSSTIVNNHKGVWWAPECLSFETWLLHDAWEEGSGLFFFDCETLRKMTADRYIALGGHWCCLRTWIGSEGDAHQPLVICPFTEYSWARARGSAVCYLASRKREIVSFISTLPRPLSYFCLSSWELASFDKGFNGGRVIRTMWVPMGMVDLPTALER